MKRILIVAAAVVSALALNACGASCKDGCENVIKQCKLDTGTLSASTYCESQCTILEDKCSNIDDMASCWEDASDCNATDKCEACKQK